MNIRVEKRVRKSQDEQFLRKGLGSANILDKWLKGLRR